MSMISAQIDELRELADDIESRYGYPTAVEALREAADTIRELRDDLQRANAEYAKLRDEFDKMDKWHSAELIAEMDENAKLREQMERLVTLLRVDCDIDASWDGLRRFWSIGLTENGCLMRDRACKAEAENARLRELVRRMRNHIKATCGECDGWYCSNFDEDNECCVFDSLTRELGVEVDA